MCRSRYRYTGGPEDERIEKMKFYKHLKTYLIVNGLLMFFSVRDGNDYSFMYVAFFWGIGLMNHYFKVFGWDGLNDRNYDYRDRDDIEIVETFEDRRRKPRWRDKDLV